MDLKINVNSASPQVEPVDKPDWRAVVNEEMTREEIVKEDGRYLVYYGFKPAREP